jgi:hypothetical protein
VNYILQANLLDTLGGDDDPLPPDGANPHPTPCPVSPLAAYGMMLSLFRLITMTTMPMLCMEMHLLLLCMEMLHMLLVMAIMCYTHLLRSLRPRVTITTFYNLPLMQWNAFTAIHNMGDLMNGIPNIINNLVMETIIGAKFQLLDVPDAAGDEKKCFITIFSPATL